MSGFSLRAGMGLSMPGDDGGPVIEISKLDFEETALAGAALAVLSVYEARAMVTLSSLNFDDVAAAGDALAALEVGMPWTFKLLDDAGGRFAISGRNIVRGLTPLDHKAMPAPAVTIEATDGKRVRRKTFTINVRGINAWSPMHAKLEAGQNATLLVNGDSTAYADPGIFYRLAEAIGDMHDATVIIYRWAEWQINAATGPKAYAAPVTLRTGRRGTLTVYLAALPGGMAGYMFADQRAAALAIPTPDLCIMHQGHNMQSFELSSGDVRYVSGKSAFLGPIAMTCLKWPGVPQIITTQNPKRSSAGYDKVRAAILEIGASLTDIMVIDTHQAFMDAGKPPTWYLDDTHPNELGYAKIAEYLITSYRGSTPVAGYTTAPWPLTAGTNLHANPDFTNWTGAVPVNWSAQAPATASKDANVKWPGFAHSFSMTPNGNAAAGMVRYIRTTELTPLLGKRVTVAILYYSVAGQRSPTINWVVKSGGGTRTLVGAALQFGGAGDQVTGGWMMAVFHNVLIDADIDPNAFTTYFSIRAGFGVTAPASNLPLRLQKIMMVEGDKPRIGLAA
ncbi:SGNH/GDSL hydrolase family protein [Agrobacterium sp. LAD9]|uniref:SGNH/GDSL hydrolase family protein n=1 Tax=Agrobacterium sp. LAD9 TaxID=2055153 RepID=UPI001FCEC1B1|nr:SGNH/GDSL hydrolase family protein [Agrobacterium sp. LAD9]